MDKVFIKVDEQGNYIEPVLLQDDENVPVAPDQYHVEPYSNELRFYSPRYEFTTNTWVEGKDSGELLTQAKEEKFKELSLACQEAILGYFEATVNSVAYLFSFDREAQANFTGTMALFSDGFIQTVEWTAYRNGIVERISLTKEQFYPVVMNAFTRKNSKIARLRNELQPLAESATTIEEVQAITW